MSGVAKSKIVPVILCGGNGKRLWPVSRLNRPKQFMRLRRSGLTLFQETIKRFQDFEKPIIVTTVDYEHAVEEQLEQINVEAMAIICEPIAHNTGSAIAMALRALDSFPGEKYSVLVLPCDHLIDNVEGLKSLVQESSKQAKSNIVLFGIEPSYPATQYGYIEVETSNKDMDMKAAPVRSFKEKPNKELAGSYLESGNFYWNSGIFYMGLDVAINAYKEHAPTIWFKTQKINVENIELEDYQGMLSRPFDKLVLEYAQNIVVQKCAFKWADIGSWIVLFRHWTKFRLF